jgi:hypothetical protein
MRRTIVMQDTQKPGEHAAIMAVAEEITRSIALGMTREGPAAELNATRYCYITCLWVPQPLREPPLSSQY